MIDKKFEFDRKAFKERLVLLVDQTGLTAPKLSEIASISNQAFHGYLSEKSIPSSAVIAAWAIKLDISANWLLFGEEPMFRSAAPASQLQDPVAQRVETVAKVMREAGASDEEIRRAVLAAVGAEPSPAWDLPGAAGKSPAAEKKGVK